MGMEVSRQRGVCNLVLLVGLVKDVNRVSEDALWREELLHKVVPVRQVVFASRALPIR